jgi:hypothetical protein
VARVIEDHQVYLLYRDDLTTVPAGSAGAQPWIMTRLSVR